MQLGLALFARDGVLRDNRNTQRKWNRFTLGVDWLEFNKLTSANAIVISLSLDVFNTNWIHEVQSARQMGNRESLDAVTATVMVDGVTLPFRSLARSLLFSLDSLLVSSSVHTSCQNLVFKWRVSVQHYVHFYISRVGGAVSYMTRGCVCMCVESPRVTGRWRHDAGGAVM